eukprot:gene10346-13279_t
MGSGVAALATVYQWHVDDLRFATMKSLAHTAKQEFAHQDLVRFAYEAKLFLIHFVPMHPRGNLPAHVCALTYSHAVTMMTSCIKAAVDEHVRIDTERWVETERLIEEVSTVASYLNFMDTTDVIVEEYVDEEVEIRTEAVTRLAEEVNVVAMDKAVRHVDYLREETSYRELELIVDELWIEAAEVCVDVTSICVRDESRDLVHHCVAESVGHETSRIIDLLEEIYAAVVGECLEEKLHNVTIESIQYLKAEREAEELSRQQMYLIDCIQHDDLAITAMVKAHQRELVKYLDQRESNYVLEPQGPGRLRTKLFLWHQNKRMEAVDYLIARATRAVVTIHRNSAHKYLVDRVTAAFAWLDQQGREEPAVDTVLSLISGDGDEGRSTPSHSEKRRRSSLSRTTPKRKSSVQSKLSAALSYAHPAEVDFGALGLDGYLDDEKGRLEGKRVTDPLDSAEELLALLRNESLMIQTGFSPNNKGLNTNEVASPPKPAVPGSTSP